jgi:hypothetical protein
MSQEQWNAVDQYIVGHLLPAFRLHPRLDRRALEEVGVRLGVQTVRVFEGPSLEVRFRDRAFLDLWVCVLRPWTCRDRLGRAPGRA